MPKIYSCKGKHFKVYESELGEVLEHDNEENPVRIDFGYENDEFTITVSEFVRRKMRLEKQKNRGDIYILQNQFEPLLQCLEILLKKLNIDSDPEKEWRFGSPQAREGRQGVPKLVKLSEVSEVSLVAPFDGHIFRINNGYLVADSEIPGTDQKKWFSEGSERQIHLGIFGYNCALTEEKMTHEVKVKFPLRKLENNFLKPIQTNWVN